MGGFLKRVFGRTPPVVPVVEVDIPPLYVPDCVAVIGDIHGCATLTRQLIERVNAQHPEAHLLFVGDFIDRGEESADVLKMLMDMPEATCLMGNHERMCLDFLDDPEERGARWMRNGGLQTVASYGVSGTQTELTKMRDALAVAMGDHTINWLINRPLYAQFGNLYAIHAGADPQAAIEGQGEKPLIWGHPLFRKQPRTDGQWVVHGHTIVDLPMVEQGRVSIDTGAYATGVLSAAVFAGADVAFLQAKL